MAAFMDLHVKNTDKVSLKETLRQAERLGFDVVAISCFVEDLQSVSKGKKKQKDNQSNIPLPEDLILNEEDMKSINWTRKAPRQLSRISTIISDASQTHKLAQENVQRFDLVAVQPTSEKTFHLACLTLDIDIIIIDVTQKLPYFIKRPSVNTAIERGIHFEINYSPAVMDTSARVHMISNIQSLVSVCKGKNLILSSGCEQASSIRGPYDVANLSMLFGMTQAQGKAAVCRNCRAVLFHAESRRSCKSTMSALQITEATFRPKRGLMECDEGYNKGESKAEEQTTKATSSDTVVTSIDTEITNGLMSDGPQMKKMKT
ncbi:ribonuclease P protein subunit p30-like [Ylistrum balloti]|uniref:ribonuclease P protein subunit p30-like n=1 Tax=Ylistrum balloti TaxID=509963 RepID=UPI002905DC14|nr:ribonuclease P protein subunit p30-like [Ylistrum balloti]